MSKFVRLKHYDPAKGHVIRCYSAFGIRFEGQRGWYQVQDHEAAYLATVHQRPGDKDSPLAFDVRTRCLQTPACDRCSVGVMDADNPHLWGECRCECHGQTAAVEPQGEVAR